MTLLIATIPLMIAVIAAVIAPLAVAIRDEHRVLSATDAAAATETPSVVGRSLEQPRVAA